MTPDAKIVELAPSWFYEYQTGRNTFDNTSRQHLVVGTRAQAAERARRRAEEIMRGDPGHRK